MTDDKDEEFYLKAAERLLQTCDYALYEIERRIQPADSYKIENVLPNIYYLSGYAIECLSWYGFLLANKIYPDNKVWERNQVRLKGARCCDIKNHNHLDEALQPLKLVLEQELNEIDYIPYNDNDTVKKMHKAWSTQLRYYGYITSKNKTKWDPKDLREFLKFIERFKSKLQKLHRKPKKRTP